LSPSIESIRRDPLWNYHGGQLEYSQYQFRFNLEFLLAIYLMDDVFDFGMD